MARPVSDEELQLKKRARRRLVGAIVLVTAVAVILPMILDSEPRPSSQNVEIQIPPTDAGEFKPDPSAKREPGASTPIKGLPETTAAPAEKSDAPTPIADAPPAAQSASPSAPAAEKPKSAAREPEKPQVARSEPAARNAGSGAFVVQVAALADRSKAKQLEQRMASTGLKTYTEVVKTQSGQVTRVRAGPFATREAAEKARTQLKKAGIDGQVMAR